MTYQLTTAKAGRLSRQSAATPRQVARFIVEDLADGADQVRVEATDLEDRHAFHLALPRHLPPLESHKYNGASPGAATTELWIFREEHRQPLRHMAAQGKRAPKHEGQFSLDGLAASPVTSSDAIRGGL